MSQDSYDAMIGALKAVGLNGQLNRPDQLIVSAQPGPVWPDRGNSFWLSVQEGIWYLSTWLPACYRIPTGQDVVEICTACMETVASAIYRVPEEIVKRFGLERIADSEFERLFPDGDEDQ